MEIISSHFGVDATYNAAALHLIKTNHIDAVSCLAFSKGAEKDYHALLRSKHDNPSLKIGLQFILSSQLCKPLSSYFPNGQFLPHAHFSCNAHLGLLDGAALKLELLAQWRAFQDIFGYAPDFIAGYKNIQALPIVSQIIAEILAEKAFQGVVLLKKQRFFNLSIQAYKVKKHYQYYQINVEQDISHLTPRLFKKIKQSLAQNDYHPPLPNIIYTTPRLYKSNEVTMKSDLLSACPQFNQIIAIAEANNE